MEPDQIDMMSAEELRAELRRMLKCADGWKRSADSWRGVGNAREDDAPDIAERAFCRANAYADCANDLLSNAREQAPR